MRPPKAMTTFPLLSSRYHLPNQRQFLHLPPSPLTSKLLLHNGHVTIRRLYASVSVKLSWLKHTEDFPGKMFVFTDYLLILQLQIVQFGAHINNYMTGIAKFYFNTCQSRTSLLPISSNHLPVAVLFVVNCALNHPTITLFFICIHSLDARLTEGRKRERLSAWLLLQFLRKLHSSPSFVPGWAGDVDTKWICSD